MRRNKTKRALLVCLFALCLTPALVGCEAMLFYPQKTLLRTPADVGLHYSDVTFEHPTEGQEGALKIHGWWLPARGEPQATVLFAHGNAENISTHLASVYWLPQYGINVMLVDYRGYGLSEGVPSVAGAVSDMSLAVADVEARTAATDPPWFALGQSLGASIIGNALRESESSHLAGVILDAGFAEFSQVAAEVAASHWLTWLFQYPAAWAMPDGFDLIDRVADLPPLPLLLIHGRSDPVIGYQHVERLYQRAQQPKQLLSYDGGHIETFNSPDNRQVLLDFIRRGAERWKEKQQMAPGIVPASD